MKIKLTLPYPLGEDFDRREWELVRKQWVATE